MTIKNLISLVNGILLNIPSNFDECISNFSLNSKTIKESTCFIAINKGYLYIEDAISNGALAIITDKDIRLNTKIAIIKVDSIYNALLNIMGFIRTIYSYIPLIAITGSVGKTTTKELISNILSSKYKVLKNIGNKNNYIGLSETIFNLNEEYDFIVLEIGMNHESEISKLVEKLKPDISLITNIGTSHIGNLGSKKNILKSKLEIISCGRPYLIVPYLDKKLVKVKYEKIDKCKDIKIKNIKINDKLNFNLVYKNNSYFINFPVPCKSYISNILVAFKTLSYFDVDIKSIINGISSFKVIKGRMDIIKKDDYTIIDDTYNSSYESLKGAVNYLNLFKKKMVILGDIKELGKYSIKIHKKINRLLKNISMRNIVLLGKDTKYINGIYFEDKMSLFNYLDTLNLKDYVILVKGSRAMHMEEIIDYLNR